MSTSVCLVFGDPSGVPGKDVGETEGAPTARRCIFFYYSPLELYNIFWNAIVVMPECRTGSYLCWLTVGGCNAGFIKAVSAGVHFCIAAHRELCCWLLRTVLFHFSFQAVLWNSVFQLIFLQQWFFSSGRETSSCLNSWALWHWWYHSLCLYSHGQLIHIISTGITRSFIMKYLIFLTQRGISVCKTNLK